MAKVLANPGQEASQGLPNLKVVRLLTCEVHTKLSVSHNHFIGTPCDYLGCHFGFKDSSPFRFRHMQGGLNRFENFYVNWNFPSTKVTAPVKKSFRKYPRKLVTVAIMATRIVVSMNVSPRGGPTARGSRARSHTETVALAAQ